MLLRSLEALQSTLAAEFSQSRGMFTELAHIETLLAETYRDRVQYELLQNSDDAGASHVTVTVAADGSVRWANDGRAFNAADAESLCRSASSTKARGQSIGYRGIGFKSLAAVASHIDVTSAGVSFSFDRGQAAHLLSSQLHRTQAADLPLIRIPLHISPAAENAGAEFLITPLNSSTPILGPIDPLALLFLRHVETLTVSRGGQQDRYTIERQPAQPRHCHVGECGRPGRIRGVTTATPSYKGHRYPVEIINHCVWLDFRFPLSFREVEELMLVRGVAVS